ncbi:MAG: C39 family peptidase [Anaerolineae bacterium]|nr:C39 family peptidase [Anaerolineae bacterium]
MSTTLQVPYKSQSSATAGYSANDCGPACIAMMLAATGRDVTIDSLYRHPSIAGNRGGIAIGALMTLSKAYGIPLKFERLTLDSLKEKIDSGRPVMVLADYKPIVDNHLNGVATNGLFGHFPLVVGYDDDSIIVHDSYWKTDGGAYRHWPTAVFNKAWAGGLGSWGNNYNGQSVYPVDAIAQPILTEEITFPMDEGLKRRIRAKALFEGEPLPVITNREEYDKAIDWLGVWGQYGEIYYVQAGDTLSGIAYRRFGRSSFYDALSAYNGLADPNLLEVGQKILIPLPSLEDAAIPPPDTGSSTPPSYDFTNQQLINAFYRVYRARGGATDAYWEAIVLADLEYLATARQAKYAGPAIGNLPNLPDDIKRAVATELGV